jgi:hypothetical protein
MFHGVLDHYCNTSLRLLSSSETQVVIGIGTENNDSLEGVSISQQANMRHVVMNSSTQFGGTRRGNIELIISYRTLFADTSSMEDAAVVAAEAIIEKLAKSLVAMQDKADID